MLTIDVITVHHHGIYQMRLHSSSPDGMEVSVGIVLVDPETLAGWKCLYVINTFTKFSNTSCC